MFNGKLMACKDPFAFAQQISKCATPFEGVAKCPQYLAATKTYGAKCLALPTFGAENAPPFGLFACRYATGEMATLCKVAGFPVAGAGAGAGAGAAPGAISGAYSGASTGATLATVGGLGVLGLATVGGAIGGAIKIKQLQSSRLTSDEDAADLTGTFGNPTGEPLLGGTDRGGPGPLAVDASVAAEVRTAATGPESLKRGQQAPKHSPQAQETQRAANRTGTGDVHEA
jgi:hypothetical protein